MKYLKNFSLFEAYNSFRIGFTLPATEEEVDAINAYPEFKTLENICDRRIKFRRNKSGVLKLDTCAGYPFTISKGGKLLYGSYDVGPSEGIVIRDWHTLIDFISVYTLSKWIGINVNFIDKFVFIGKPISPKGWQQIKRTEKSQILIDIAKKYNPPGEIDKIISDAEEKAENFITDIDLISQTEAFKWGDKIFGLSLEKVGDYEFDLVPKSVTPYGISDFIYSEGYLRKKIRLGLGPKAVTINQYPINVKTLKGLEKGVENAIKTILAPHLINPRFPYFAMSYEITKYVLSQFGHPISREMVIDRLRNTIKPAFREFFLEKRFLNPYTGSLDIESINNAMNFLDKILEPQEKSSMLEELNTLFKSAIEEYFSNKEFIDRSGGINIKNLGMIIKHFDLISSQQEVDSILDKAADAILELPDLSYLSEIKMSIPKLWKRIEFKIGSDAADRLVKLYNIGF